MSALKGGGGKQCTMHNAQEGRNDGTVRLVIEDRGEEVQVLQSWHVILEATQKRFLEAPQKQFLTRLKNRGTYCRSSDRGQS